MTYLYSRIVTLRVYENLTTEEAAEIMILSNSHKGRPWTFQDLVYIKHMHPKTTPAQLNIKVGIQRDSYLIFLILSFS